MTFKLRILYALLRITCTLRELTRSTCLVRPYVALADAIRRA